MSEANALPQRTQVYQSHHLGSTRWLEQGGAAR
jgi:hypothetical protein